MLNAAGSWVTIVLWIGFAICAAISVALFLGFGTNLIAGYNTASQAEKQKYDKKKLSLVVGSGMAVVAAFLLVMAAFAASLPFYCLYIFQAVLIADCILVVILCNTVCKK